MRGAVLKVLAVDIESRKQRNAKWPWKKAALLARGVMPYLVARQSQVSKNKLTHVSTPTQTHPHFHYSITQKRRRIYKTFSSFVWNHDITYTGFDKLGQKMLSHAHPPTCGLILPFKLNLYSVIREIYIDRREWAKKSTRKLRQNEWWILNTTTNKKGAWKSAYMYIV